MTLLSRWLGRQARTVDEALRRRTIAVSVETDAVRVLVVRGREVLAWGTASLGTVHETPEEGAATDRQRRAAALRALLDRLDVSYGRVVSDLPLYAPLERHIRLSKVARRHLGSVVLSEVLESIPFSQGEVDIAWQSRKNGAGQEASATAVAKATTDGLVRSLREARARPAATYSRAAALARAAGVADGIVAHLTSDSLAVVLVRDHLPRVVYEEAQPGSDAAPRAVAELVARAVEQVAGYQQGINGIDEESALPVVLTGRLASQGPLLDELRGLLRREALPLVAPLRCPEHFPADEYAVNLGLALADRARDRSGGQVSRRQWRAINLLPERHIPVRIPMGRFACLVALMLLAIAGINATARVDEVVAKATALSVRVGQLQQQDRQYRVALADASVAEQNNSKVEQFVTDLESGLAGLRGEVHGLVGRLDAFTGSAAATGVQLASVVPLGNGFVVAGTALTYEDALRYAGALRSSGQFSDVALSRVEASQYAEAGGSESQAASFQVKVAIAPIADGGSVAQR